MTKKRVLVGLSWGVDSAVSAYLLKEQGYDVVAGFMKNYADESNPNCHTREDRNMAIKVAQHLGIQDFVIFDFREEYQERIINYIYEWYKQGITPNPDILCNNLVKFDLFLEKAMAYGFDYIATGHYARVSSVILSETQWSEESSISKDPSTSAIASAQDDKSYQLLRGLDHNKDQSYFLSGLNQQQLSKSLFPVGELTKPEVRAIAEKIWLPNADRKDSQWLCFIGNVPMREFLKQKLPTKSWDIVTTDWEVVGQHDGAWFWTIGQSRGLDLNKKAYVVATDIKKNTVTVSFDRDNQELLHEKASCTNRHRINPNHSNTEMKVGVKIRYRQDPPVAATLNWNEKNNTMNILFTEPQWGIAPWQSIVAYDGEVCLGGGVIV